MNPTTSFDAWPNGAYPTAPSRNDPSFAGIGPVYFAAGVALLVIVLIVALSTVSV